MKKSEQNTIEKALQVLEEALTYENQVFHSAETATNYFKLRLGFEKVENFDVAFLTTQHQLIECRRMFTGTINSCAVFPREIARTALELNAASVILAHNHPSGVKEPSRADDNITDHIRKALELFDIRTLDHLIIAGNNAYSYAQEGKL